MSLNLTKTWETVMKGKTRKQIPEKIPEIERKSELKLYWESRLAVILVIGTLTLTHYCTELQVVSIFLESARFMGTQITSSPRYLIVLSCSFFFMQSRYGDVHFKINTSAVSINSVSIR